MSAQVLDLKQQVHDAATAARIASRRLATLSTAEKNRALHAAADSVLAQVEVILAANAAAVRDVLVALRADLDVVVDALDRAAGASGPEDVELGALATIARTIAEGNTGAARIPGKHGGAHKQYAVVSVLVPDAPGELARLLGDVGAAGVNLEDLQLEHAAGRAVGMAAISVVPARAEHLESELTARGWRLVS